MRTIAFYNLKGGVGKTAAAVNVAWHAARWKHRTVLWDLDPQGAAGFYLGVEGAKSYHAGNLVSGRQGTARLKVPTRWYGLEAIPADISLRNIDVKLAEQGSPRKLLQRMVAPLGDDCDLCILDCPPTLSPVAESIFGAADELYVPVVPTHLSLRALEQVQDWVGQWGRNAPEVIPFFNMVDRRRLLHVEMLVRRPEAMRDGLKTWIPYSTHVEQMGQFQAPLSEFAPHTPSARAFRALWYEIAERSGLQDESG